ncbi:hypothetical protein [Desulfurobacterium indicum]|uniref:HEAT repeat domain-containing protein n=1 Tax=Desulfurobacterium indicum TaxID=1914305 RepID=A0A1R1MNE0_9BACT|nr:hypothetical protein [Desulfurobacterium indicum]OMH41204.1 hypothetical protein BLW93_01555 [Desulfurobacterium indicum]
MPKFSPEDLIMLHIFLSIIISIAIVILMPRHFKRSIRNILTIFLFNLLIPAAGYIFSMINFLIIARLKKANLFEAKKLPIRDITLEKVKVRSRKLGEAALTQLIKTKKINNEHALLIMGNFINPQTIEAAKTALFSDNDEIRLYAFAILSKLEKEIDDKISFLKTKLQKTDDKKEKAFIHFELASLYWDMVYLKVVDKELIPFIIKEALNHIQNSLKLHKTPEIELLAGKIHLKLNNKKEAKKFLLSAFNQGDKLMKMKVVPYLAEIAFYEKDYKTVEKLFSIIEAPLHPEVCFMKLFWTGKKW